MQQLVKLSVANEKSFSSLFPFLFQLSTARCVFLPHSLPSSFLPAVVTEAARKVELVNSNRIESTISQLLQWLSSARFVLWLFIAFSAALGQTKVLPRRGVRGGDRGGRQENSQLALWFICLASKLCYLVSTTIYGQRKIPNLDSWQSMKRKCSNASIFPSLSPPSLSLSSSFLKWPAGVQTR